MITLSKVNYKIPAKALTLRDQSVIAHGGKLFNLLPRGIRDFNGNKDGFKQIQDDFIENIPDQLICEGLYLAPISSTTNRNSNSIIDRVKYLNVRDRRNMRMENYDSLI